MTAPEDYTTFLVKHLPSEITPSTLRTIFGAYGKVLAAFIVKGKRGRKGSDQSDGTELNSNKFAFVKIAQCDVEKVLSESIFAEGARLKVSVAQRDRRAPKGESAQTCETTALDKAEHGPVVTKNVKALANKAAEIFIRGVPFECTEEDLESHFREHFGAPKRVYLVKDPLTHLPKGTAFIEFVDPGSVDRVMTYQDTSNTNSAVDINIEAVQRRIVGKSLVSSVVGDTDKLMLRGRTMLCSRVLCPEDANMLRKKPDEREDTRNIRLLEESIPKEDGALRTRRLQEVATLRARFATNGNLIVSTTRLSVRRLPKVVDEKGLRAFFTKMAFDATKQAEKYLTGSLLQEARKSRASIKQVKVVRASANDKGEGSSEKALGKSRGFGFVEFRAPVHALLVMRHLMQHPRRAGVWKALDVKIKRDEDEPIVEFAVDKANVLARMKERLRERGKDAPRKTSNNK